MIEISGDNLFDDLTKSLRALDGISVNVGLLEDSNSEILNIGYANEFGTTIIPKNGKYLTLPLKPELKGKRATDFDLTFIPGKKGESAILAKVNGKDIEPYFLLVKEVVIPERSFIRYVIDDQATVDRILNETIPILEMVLIGKATPHSYALALGEAFVGAIRDRISSNIQPANSPLTVGVKGTGKGTLVDNGSLIQHVRSEVLGK
ncbi:MULTISPECIES: hypothetical protein [Leptospira]|uniref:Uncharacterized protein n=3 Tax=Leptospira interrogans TaxID=173 RepID=A0AAQ0AYI4_LEPIR|nr:MULTISPECIES: hypothetical protein [Leptospira]KAK2618190.1 hypothetical protein CFV95_003730 [Leptospira interrogans]MCL8267242.1 hypothetical protein [Leptospira weilii]QOI43327.1 hypothetical protein Lepto782_14385 [Leptospira interrogans serovar Canicola]QOI51883.1 hypothetical protein Lepto1489_16575 [Leptospira interrogans serovar Bataviae]